MTELDLTVLPRRETAWLAFVNAVSKLDDRDERHYLEFKSDVDLTKKDGQAKVARFILGAANRLPDKIGNFFEGRALMVLGVSPGSVKGVPPFEMYELEAYVQKFTGVPGPAWDARHVRLPESTNTVVVIVVEPPKQGDPIWICQQEGPLLLDGEIYFRADGNTRKAKSAEVKLLQTRAEPPGGKADIDVQLLGSAVRFRCSDEPLETYLDRVEADLLSALPAPPEPEPMPGSLLGGQLPGGMPSDSGISAIFDMAARTRDLLEDVTPRPPNHFGRREIEESRSEDEYRAEIKQWRKDCRKKWPKLLDKIIAYSFGPVRIKVVNNSRVFLKSLEVKIHLEGGVVGVRKRTDRVNLVQQLPEPPREWGPWYQNFFDGLAGITAPNFGAPFVGGNPGLTFKNGGSVNLIEEFDTLRPQGQELGEDDYLVLVVRDWEQALIVGTWTATAHGYDDVFTGEIEVQVDPKRWDLTNHANAQLNPTEE